MDNKKIVEEITKVQVEIFKSKGIKEGSRRIVDRIAEGTKFNNTYFGAIQEFKKNTNDAEILERISYLESIVSPIANLRFGMVWGAKNQLTEEEHILDNYRTVLLLKLI